MSDICYVIAGGPSLTGFDFDALPSGFRIGVNHAAWFAKCHAICTISSNFHYKERERLMSFGRNAHAAIVNKAFTPLPGVTYWMHVRNLEGVALAPGTLTGSNSGFAALNLAIQLGYKDIALLGFDYRFYAGRTYFYETDKPRDSWSRHTLALQAEEFYPVAKQAETLGVRITNFVGPYGSLVKAFPSAPLSDLI